MSLSRFIQTVRSFMARKSAGVGKYASSEQLRVHLIPAKDSTVADPLRLNEIADLVAQIVLLGRSRRRVSKEEKEGQDAA
jgi:hypothetical protein